MCIRDRCRIVLETDKNLPDLDSITVPSRIVKLPLSWDDPQTQLAAERYMKTVRPNAPWCPSNLEFIRRINGLDSIEEVKKIVFDAKYLVLGLGDVDVYKRQRILSFVAAGKSDALNVSITSDDFSGLTTALIIFINITS